MADRIPFVKPARVGNFKIWRTKTTAGKGKGKTGVEQICVSDLEGLWQVKIPSTLEMFAMLEHLYSTQEENLPAMLSFLGNMFYVSVTANGYYQRAVELCSIAFANPSLLEKKGKGHKELVENVKALAKAYLEWRKVYDERIRQSEPTEQEMIQDEIAEQAIGELE